MNFLNTFVSIKLSIFSLRELEFAQLYLNLATVDNEEDATETFR